MLFKKTSNAPVTIHVESESMACPYLRQLLTDFQKSFTVTFGRKFAVSRLQKFPPRLNADVNHLLIYCCLAAEWVERHRRDVDAALCWCYPPPTAFRRPPHPPSLLPAPRRARRSTPASRCRRPPPLQRRPQQASALQ